MSIGQGQGLFGATLAAAGNRATTDPAGFGREWIGVLEDVPLFAGLTRRHIRHVARMARRVTVAPNTVLVSPERRADGFYVLLDGYVEVETAGGERIDLGPGRFFGEMALLDSGPRTATVTATTELLAMRISQLRFRELIESEPKIAYAIMRELAHRVRHVEEAHS
jgi:CRP-like cAMP-binding protein